MQIPKLLIDDQVVSMGFHIGQKVYFKCRRDGTLWWGHVVSITINIYKDNPIDTTITVNPFEQNSAYSLVHSNDDGIIFFKDLESFETHYKNEISSWVQKEKESENK